MTAEAQSTGIGEMAFVNTNHDILTAKEVAAELRCSKAQAYRLMNGVVDGLTPLPTLPLGRKKVVLRSSFESWKRANEQNRVTVTGDSEANAVDA
jgi:hypothetical protein